MAFRANVYYDVHAILAEETKIPVTFRVGAVQMGPAINPDETEEDLKPGAEVEIPLWMLPKLAANGVVEPSIPNFYGQSIRKQLSAARSDVNLGHYCPYYYEAGSRLNSIINEGPNTEETLGKFLTSTFVGRFEDMGKLQLEQAASGLAPGAVDAAVLASKMAQEEKHIYAMARRQEESLRKWMGWNQRAVAPSRKRKGFLAG